MRCRCPEIDKVAALENNPQYIVGTDKSGRTVVHKAEEIKKRV